MLIFCLLDTTTKVEINLFVAESPPCTLGKRPHLEANDLDIARQEAKRLEKERIAATT